MGIQPQEKNILEQNLSFLSIRPFIFRYGMQVAYACARPKCVFEADRDSAARRFVFCFVSLSFRAGALEPPLVCKCLAFSAKEMKLNDVINLSHI